MAAEAKLWKAHLTVLRIDVGTHGEELVDWAEPAAMRRNVERGLAALRWLSGEGKYIGSIGSGA
jgi:hypothetical protein